MKIVLAPDSFKDSLSAVATCEALERGIKSVIPKAHIVKLPMADGGEGTVQALVSSTGGRMEQTEVHDPLGRKISASYGILGDDTTAVIEMAAASGLPLVRSEKRNPLHTTTFGTGELLLAAAEKGCRKFIIGIGGSATNDAGAGMAQALGIRFYAENGQKLTALMNGDALGRVHKIDFSDLNAAFRNSRIVVACDVDNPLLGPEGCAQVYAPQKGASPEIVSQLEANMSHFVEILENTIQKSVRNIPGAGAAGGLGAGLMAFTGAELKSGIEIVLSAGKFAEKIQGADLILTGEGRIDYQTAFGKTISGVAREAQKQGIPVIAIGGSVEPNIDNLYKIGVRSCFSICDQPMSLETAIKNADTLIERISERIMRFYLIHGRA